MESIMQQREIADVILEKNLDDFFHVDVTSHRTCIFCGTLSDCIDFKDQCVCNECLDFVKEFV